MKITFQYILVIASCMALFSCEKDNFEEPKSKLDGRLVYQGQPIGVENYQVPFELYQYGFGRVGAIGSAFAQDGLFSAMLFDGDYKFIVPNGQGPFVWPKTAGGGPDSLSIQLSGSKVMDIDVTPYYMIRNPQITAAGGKVTANFSVEKVITGADARNIDDVTLYINKTQFVSGNENEKIASAGKGGGDIADPNNISLEVGVPAILPTQNYVFARVSIKISGIEDRIFSPLVKVSL
jgi:hypothetical protein